MTRSFVLACLLLLVPSACADGGRLRLHEVAGPFLVTLFTAPDPLTEGRADFSVAIERGGRQSVPQAADEGLVQNAKVTLVLTAEGKDKGAASGSERIVLPASHAAATSAFLQAANFTLPHAGVWRVTVMVQQGSDVGECSGEIEVLPYRIATDETVWEIALVPIAIVLFAVHQARKARLGRTLDAQ
jgi:hypothetical protein